MSLCALIWSATAAQAIELDRPLMPQSALIWESEEAPHESLTTQKPVGTTWKKLSCPRVALSCSNALGSRCPLMLLDQGKCLGI